MNDSFLDLQNKTALITGASGGIGAASALLLAQSGVFCWLHYNTNEDKALKLQESIRQNGGDGRLIKADLTDPHDISNLLKQLVADTPLDILVNNSGITKDSLFSRCSSNKTISSSTGLNNSIKIYKTPSQPIRYLPS